MFTVNKGKCTACGMCAKICPVNRIVMDRSAEKLVPSVAANMEKTCFACGHCEAGCPHGAIELVIDLPGEKTSLLSELSISPAQIGQHLRGRRSIRYFKNDIYRIQQVSITIDAGKIGRLATKVL